MSHTASVLLCIITLTGFIIQPANAAVYIEGYHLKDGAYIRPHWIGGNDYSVYDNWLTPEYIALYGRELDEDEDDFCADRRNFLKLNRRYCCGW